jgi:hypothetical protein
MYSLSPLLFCIALVALTDKLNRADWGYQVHKSERKISHLLYMDELKLLVREEDELEIEIKIVTPTCKDIHMNFVLKIMQTFDNNIAYSTIFCQLLRLCSNEITLDIFRQ